MRLDNRRIALARDVSAVRRVLNDMTTLTTYPVLLRPTPSARLTKRVGGMFTVREVLLMLIDGADELTAHDLQLVCRLYHLGAKARRERMKEMRAKNA